MKILVLGGDGYLGWPTALHFSARDHEVIVVDNLIKRWWEHELGVGSLVPILSLQDRVRAWEEITGRHLGIRVGDLQNTGFVEELFRTERPDAVIHYGEQCSAPFSMIDVRRAVDTQANNVVGTLNVLFAMAKHVPDCHLVKLGTMGEYGTPNIDIEEGYIEIEHKGRKDVLPFPKQAGSFYHLSKVHDSHNIEFACKIWKIRATDLNQGVVYGHSTVETARDDRLATAFRYDETFGTTLNRFCVQAVVGHPLTVYGKGGQQRCFLNIVDTLQCVELAVQNPAEPGRFRVFNQFTELFSIGDLAKRVQQAASSLGMEAEITHLENPRVELEEHYFNARNTNLKELGLDPCYLTEEFIASMLQHIARYRDSIRKDWIAPKVQWRKVESHEVFESRGG